MNQITDTILMVRPASFRANEQTAGNNYYQRSPENVLPETLLARARAEFDSFSGKLKEAGINVIVVDGEASVDTPDAHFPNNWISFHQNGTVALYPMFAENRRWERREDILDIIEEKGFEINDVMDYSSAEEEGVFLEGTGSLILDRVNRIAYCALSPRADEDIFIEFCEDFEFTPVIFEAMQSVNGKRLPIYHTNVMMCLGEAFAVICLDSIDDKKERKNVINHLKGSGKEIITISEEQVTSFAGNMLQVVNNNNKKYIALSSAAYNCLTEDQRSALEKHGDLIHSSLELIETCGGGSARCMMAEVFLPKQ
ncbi:amidinotransferase [Leptobacterium flavescens]|uniref:Amidinotransferase n=1 Tax=Leptobacterium flavescens TaxID=472055 RepID=A0A6P0UXM8_9FLAO|nr:arginine deiminase-related protein [Leptobacterium flavescens]NER15216.1 amidinotransferase [Leptobacterium flavescens]